MLLEERTGGGWTTLSTRLDETGHLVGRLLGLSLAQFCQVVLLPQGQFADFLRADAEQRRDAAREPLRHPPVRRRSSAGWSRAGRRPPAPSTRSTSGWRRCWPGSPRRRAPTCPHDLDPADAAGWVAALLEQARTARADAQTRAAGRRGPARGVGGDPGERHPGGRGAHPADPAAGAAGRADRRGRRARGRRRRGRGAPGRSPRSCRWSPRSPGCRWSSRRPARPRRLPAPSWPRCFPPPAPTVRPSVDGSVGSIRASAAAGPDRAVLGRPPAPRRGGPAAGHWARPRPRPTGWPPATDALQRRVVELDAQAERLAARLDAAPARRAELEAARDRSQAAVAALPGAVAARDLAAGRSEAAARRDRLDAQRVALADVVRTRTDAAQAARQTWLDLRQARLDGHGRRAGRRAGRRRRLPGLRQRRAPAPAEAGAGLGRPRRRDRRGRGAGGRRGPAGAPPPTSSPRSTPGGPPPGRRQAATRPSTRSGRLSDGDSRGRSRAGRAGGDGRVRRGRAGPVRRGARGLGARAGLPRPGRRRPSRPRCWPTATGSGRCGRRSTTRAARPVDRGPGGAAGAAGRRPRRPRSGRSRRWTGSRSRWPRALERAEQARSRPWPRLARGGPGGGP